MWQHQGATRVLLKSTVGMAGDDISMGPAEVSIDRSTGVKSVGPMCQHMGLRCQLGPEAGQRDP